MQQLDDLFRIELTRLSTLAQKGPLEVEDLRRLESLTRSLKNYTSSPLKDKRVEVSEESTEALFDLLRKLPTNEPEPTGE